MPRAIDPSLVGDQLPADYSPLNRIDFQSAKARLPDLDALVDQFILYVKDYLFPIIEDITGIDLALLLPLIDLLDLDFSSIEGFFTSLVNALVALPAALVNLIGGIVAQLTNPANSDQLQELLTGILSLLVSLPTMLIQLGQSLLNSGAGLLGISSPINLLNAFNILSPDLMGQISHSNIGQAITNLITDPLFAIESAFDDFEDWFHDATQGHVGSGSAQTIADGSTHELLGNLIPVSEGQVMPVSAWAKWAGLAGSGSPITLSVTGYNNVNDAISQAAIASHNTIPATTDWLNLTGTWTVPANVVNMRVRLVVGSGATAGTVWFDDIKATKTQSVFQRLIAGTNSGEFLNNDVEHLFTGIISNTMEIINKASQGDFQGLVDTIEGNIQEGFETIGARLNAFLHGGSPLNAANINQGQIGDQFVPGLSTIHDALVTAVGRLSGSGFDIGKVFEVLTGQTNSLVTNSSGIVHLHGRLATAESRLAALPVSLGGTGVGISFGGTVGATDIDEFERVDTNGLGSEWLQYYSSGGGKWAIPNGHDAEYMWSGTSDREFVCIRNKSSLLRSLTDYQRVSQVLSTKATRHKVLAGDWFGHNDVWLRVSDSTTSLANITGIRIRWGADGSVSIVRFLNGAATTLKSYPKGTYDPPGPGAILYGEAGDMNGGTAGQRYFRGVIGNSIQIEITETGVASGFGAAFRRWGHGGRVDGWTDLFDNGQERPGSLFQWNGMDQVFL
jgi:hypothetical protein